VTIPIIPLSLFVSSSIVRQLSSFSRLANPASQKRFSRSLASGRFLLLSKSRATTFNPLFVLPSPPSNGYANVQFFGRRTSPYQSFLSTPPLHSILFSFRLLLLTDHHSPAPLLPYRRTRCSFRLETPRSKMASPSSPKAPLQHPSADSLPLILRASLSRGNSRVPMPYAAGAFQVLSQFLPGSSDFPHQRAQFFPRSPFRSMMTCSV